MATYSADLETTTDPNDCRCWAWGVCDIEKPEDVDIGNTMETLIEYMQEKGGTYYFHNLRFDGNFILYFLLTHGYRWMYCPGFSDRKKLEPGTFTTMISDQGTWYSISIRMLPTKTGVSNPVEVIDSSKLIPMAVSDIPKTYGFEESKLSIDYNEYREPGHILTQQEIDYLKADVIIVAKAIKFMHNNGQKKMTSASNALADFKSRWDKKQYKRMFPDLNDIVDKDIRASYKGGWTYLNPKYKNKSIGNGSVYDVNSMYPWAMKNCLLPYGVPVWFPGEYKKSSIYPLYVIGFVCEFKLKPNHYPSIQIKNSIYAENEYLSKSIFPTCITLTSVDFELFKENYDYNIIEWLGGYMFKAKYGMFDEYIDYWYDVKTHSKKSGNSGMEKIAKLMLNSLYGKFGARKHGKYKIPYYDKEHDIVRYKTSDVEENRKGGYLPIATFITSYCRDKIIRAANLCGERFIYADTDSVHIIGDKPVDGLDVDNYRLGAFKLEELFIRATFIRQKTYLEVYEDDGVERINLKCCGMPKKMKDSISEEDFVEGAEFDASKNSKYAPKLMPQVVPGGVILKETTFKIKKVKTYEDDINNLDTLLYDYAIKHKNIGYYREVIERKK